MDMTNLMTALRIGLQYTSVEGSAGERLVILKAIRDIETSTWIEEAIAETEIAAENERRYWEKYA